MSNIYKYTSEFPTVNTPDFPNTSSHFIGANVLLIDKLGHGMATFVNQIHFWISNTSCRGYVFGDKKYIYNTEEAWGNQLRKSTRQIRRYVARGVKLGIFLVEKLNWNRSNRTNYITICLDTLREFLGISYQKVIHNSPCEPRKMSLPSGHDDLLLIHNNLSNNLNKSNKSIYAKNEKISEEVKKEDSDDPENQLEEVELKYARRDNDICNKMVDIWNEDAEKRMTASMSKDLASHLGKAYKDFFGKDLEKWRSYCDQISTMCTSRFKPMIKWALSFEVINRTFQELARPTIENQFEVIGSREVVDEDKIEKSIKLEIQSSVETEPQKQIRINLVKLVGPALYKSYFYNAKFDENSKLVASNAFVRSQWEDSFKWTIPGDPHELEKLIKEIS